MSLGKRELYIFAVNDVFKKIKNNFLTQIKIFGIFVNAFDKNHSNNERDHDSIFLPCLRAAL